MFIVDMKSPGITIRPLWTMPDEMYNETNETFWDNVRVPKRNMIGAKNEGWGVVTTYLTFERGSFGGWGGGVRWVTGCKRLLDNLVEFAKKTEYDGQPLAEHLLVRQKLAEMAIDIEIARMLAYRAPWMMNKGLVPVAESAIARIFGAEMRQHLDNTAMQILGLCGQLKSSSKWAPMGGIAEWMYREAPLYAIGGGTTEIERNVIARRALGLPR